MIEIVQDALERFNRPCQGSTTLRQLFWRERGCALELALLLEQVLQQLACLLPRPRQQFLRLPVIHRNDCTTSRQPSSGR